MFSLLAVLGGLVGLFFIALSIAAIVFFVGRQPDRKGIKRIRLKNREEGRRLLLRWTLADYLLLFPAAFAFLFLLVDVIAVLRDRSLFPDYHIGYLLSGFVLFLLSFAFLYGRLMLAIGLSREAPAAHQEPNPAEAKGAK